jgi:hypothetical protein
MQAPPGTVCQRLIVSDRDMLDVEKCIIGELKCENHRCAFFRTLAYIKLRIAALYLPAKAPCMASYSDLDVVLTPTEQGPIVTVRRCFNEPVIDLEQPFLAPPSPCPKRGRF